MDTCPKCGSDAIEFGDIDYNSKDETMTQVCTCMKCYTAWNDVFKYSHTENSNGKIIKQV